MTSLPFPLCLEISNMGNKDKWSYVLRLRLRSHWTVKNKISNIFERPSSLLGMPTTSQLLTVDSQKLSFFNLYKSILLQFLIWQVPWCASSTHLGCSAKLCRQARQSMHNEGHCPILIDFTFLKSLWKIVPNITPPAKPNPTSLF